MKKQLRTLQPAHPGGSFTVEDAIRAFRKVRGSDPKPGIGYDDEAEAVARPQPRSARADVSGGR
jgi:hypothetical protein